MADDPVNALANYWNGEMAKAIHMMTLKCPQPYKVHPTSFLAYSGAGDEEMRRMETRVMMVKNLEQVLEKVTPWQ